MKFLRQKKTELSQYALCLLGAFIFSFGLNIFIVPLGLYNGGLLGISQLIRTFLISGLSLPVPDSVDLSGIIYFLFNLPLFVLAYKGINRSFFLKTVCSVVVMTLLLTVIPIMPVPLIDDVLTSCILGGILTGVGIGTTLRGGGSLGGPDILGVYLTQHCKNFSVGKLTIGINFVVYAICALIADLPTFLYSVIYASISGVAIDKVHYQNIMIQATIFTKTEGIAEPIMSELYRGVTSWEGSGAYTQENEHIYVTCISKYEIPRLRKIVLSRDPHAFIIYGEVSKIDGNFIKHL